MASLRSILQGLVGQTVSLRGSESGVAIRVGPGQVDWEVTELGDDFLELKLANTKIYIAIAYISLVVKID